MKEAENINRLTDFALYSFGVKNPIEKKELVQCRTCKRLVEYLDGSECYSCAKYRTEAFLDRIAEDKAENPELWE